MSQPQPSRRDFLRLTSTSLALTAVASLPLQRTRAAAIDSQPSLKNYSIQKELFGKIPDAAGGGAIPIDLYTLTAPNIEARIITYGAGAVTLKVPDKNGRSESVSLYLDTLDDYINKSPLFGAIVGRYANRIANARFTLDGKEYQLTPNSGPHINHGGAFQKQIWQAQPLLQKNAAALKLSYTSKDGDAGFPGNLSVEVTYTLTDSQLAIDYLATTDQPTPVNLTNHTYWNLAGAGSGDVLSQELLLNADQYLAVGSDKIPTGQILPVKNTPLDFTTVHAIGDHINELPEKNYDHCFVLNKPPQIAVDPLDLPFAARLFDPKSGRQMEVRTTQPGLQLYSAKGLGARLTAAGKPYGPYHAICFETQHYPDSPNHPDFPSTILRPSQTLRERTTFTFSIRA